MTLVLPQELVDMVIDELRRDQPSLRNCSVVCTAWVPRCRIHLFKNMVVKSYGDEMRWKDILNISKQHAGLVKAFTYKDPADPLDDFRIALQESFPSFIPFKTLSLLHKLHTIEIATLPLPKYSRIIESLKFPSVKTLGIDLLAADTAYHVFQLLHPFPNLKRVSMNHIRWNTQPADEILSSDFPNLSQLKELECLVAMKSGEEFCRLITKLSMTGTLKSLRVAYRRKDLSALQGTIDSCDPNLSRVWLLYTAGVFQFVLAKQAPQLTRKI